ncbi:hypothetical protein BVL52_23430 [Pseudomonas oryzihabitans]|uniref:DUF1534 domain-containing protein n=1 Tax=Pseudomonas oryzihabitans TaxID=47885 RepID=A0ABX3IK61_9PSED|nr:hypothetical protein BVL52_23430 [Pseudomonas psychrotolerans]
MRPLLRTQARRPTAILRGLVAMSVCTDDSLSPWERVGVRASLATKSPAEKAAPFSTLRFYT